MTKSIKKHLLGTSAFSIILLVVYMIICLLDSAIEFDEHGITVWERMIQHSHYLMPALIMLLLISAAIGIFNKMDKMK